MDRRRLALTLSALYALYFIVYFHRTVTGVLKPELEQVARLAGIDTVAFASLIASAYFYAYAAMQLPAGVLADALGARRYASVSGAVMALGALLFSLGHPWAMVLGRLIIGTGAAAVYVSIQRVIGVYASKSRGGVLTGLALAIGNLGAFFATMPARFLLDAFGLNALFAAVAAASLLLSLATLRAAADSGLGEYSVVEGLKRAARQLGFVAKTYHSIAVALAYTGTYSAVLAFQSYWGYEYMKSFFGFSKDEAAAALLLLALAFLVTVPIVGYISDSVLKKRKPVLVASCFLHAAVWLALAVLPNVAHSGALLHLSMLVLGAVAATHIVISPMAREAYDNEYSGTTFAFVNTVGFLSVAVYQNLGVAVRDPLQVLSLFSLLALVTGVLALKTRETLS